MKIDLFSTTCFEHRTDSFGIYDDPANPTEPAKVANKSHPYYHFACQELMERFKNETGFRLSICAAIPVK
jgi:hypothetical protein